ncbi:MAG TPA: magnesium/cobalt transporter CorA [Phnomibacter sp.]|nr:magnesium/cobalt transporter CorA [Phnomibacter sp.]
MISTITKAIPKLEYKKLLAALTLQKTRAVVNPFHVPSRKQKHSKEKPAIYIYRYDNTKISQIQPNSLEECLKPASTGQITWINIDSLQKHEVETIGTHYGLHTLLQEDILSHGQRPKMDEIDNVLFVLMNMLFIDKETHQIETEQISIVLSNNTVISFQEDAERDVFDPIRTKLKLDNSKLRQATADHLFYSLIDVIVDSYFMVIEQLGEQIETLEEELLLKPSPSAFAKINQIRKDIILLKRNTNPVRDLVASLIRSESELLNDRTTKYFKDVYDHIVQVNDLTENYRDLIMSMQDMYINSVNLRMNEVMKTLAIITAIMAPATVIGGIFGMNFDIIPYLHHKWGFYGTVLLMLVIPIIMIWYFKRRGWFAKDIPEDTQKTI